MMFSKQYPRFFQYFSTSFITLVTTILFLVAPISIFITLNVQALPETYTPGLVLTDQDFYSLPLRFSSAEKIQKYLEAQNSILATYRVVIGLEPDDTLIQTGTFPELPTYLQPKFTAGPITGQTISVAEFIWKLTREDMGNGCHMGYEGLCINNRVLPMNPAFILAFLQKENSLVSGPCSMPNADLSTACPLGKPNTFNSINTLQYRLDRAVGYMCRDIPRATSTNFKEREAAIARSCYDKNDLYEGSPENPDWKYFKGFYKQLYYSVRLLRLRSEQCKIGGTYAFIGAGGQFQVGNTVNIQGQNIKLENGITCAMYIYTPGSQQNFYNIFKSIGGAVDLVEVRGLPADFRPKRAFLPRQIS
jgi:hypothetical protein